MAAFGNIQIVERTDFRLQQVAVESGLLPLNLKVVEVDAVGDPALFAQGVDTHCLLNKVGTVTRNTVIFVGFVQQLVDHFVQQSGVRLHFVFFQGGGDTNLFATIVVLSVASSQPAVPLHLVAFFNHLAIDHFFRDARHRELPIKVQSVQFGVRFNKVENTDVVWGVSTVETVADASGKLSDFHVVYQQLVETYAQLTLEGIPASDKRELIRYASFSAASSSQVSYKHSTVPSGLSCITKEVWFFILVVCHETAASSRGWTDPTRSVYRPSAVG